MPRNDEVAQLLGSDYGEVLWEPGTEVVEQARITQYLRWLAEHHGVAAADYQDLWEWSVGEPGAFWASLWEYFGVLGQRGDGPALNGQMPDATWFPGATLNYARNALRTARTDPGRVAIIACAEDTPPRTCTYGELATEVGRVRGALRALGVSQGDRVAAFLPNVPEAIIGLLATASLGAIWSSCSPDFGAHSVIDRFAQIRPAVLLAVGGYRYGGKEFSRDEAVGENVAGLPGLRALIMVDGPGPGSAGPGSPGAGAPGVSPGAVPPARAPSGPGPATRAAADRAGVRTLSWADLPAATGDGQPEFVEVTFGHPLWVLYSSGTTGLPKAIMHGHGGIVLEHLKALGLHQDLGPGDVFFWYTTTGWMMWNYLAGGLLAGTTLVLYDGSATYPGTDALWRLAAQTGVTYFGTGAPYLLTCAKAGLAPGRDLDLSALRGIGSTGSPLPPEGFHWVYTGVSEDAQLGSFSGGTDVCTGFVGPSPLLPVRAGLIAGRCLGARVEAFDATGKPVMGEVGELVITAPMPSMPVGFWNDPGREKYHASYFAAYPGVWRHGDWIIILPDGGCVIYGRSDATLNRGGVRMGTSEFYRVVERLPEVTDSLVVDTGQLGRPGRLVLYVMLAEGCDLDDDLTGRLRGALRSELSPRHVPDEIHQVPGIPRTLSGKKLEVPVRKILLGTPVAEAADPDALANPEVLGLFAPPDGPRVESGSGDAEQSTVIEGNA
jgi:acetoacetyl-CoA synthetase